MVLMVLVFLLSGQAAAVEFASILDELHNGDKAERMEAVETLSKMKGEESLRALLDEFNTIAEDWEVRIKALDALAASGDAMVTDALLYALIDSCPAIKWHAAVGLGGYGSDARVIDALIAALDDPTIYIREAAIGSLGQMRAIKAIPQIDKALHDSHFSVRLKATLVLESIGDERSRRLLKWMADNEPDLFIRDKAASILRTLGGRGDVPR